MSSLFLILAIFCALNLTETKLAVRAEGYKVGEIVFSPDGKLVGYGVKSGRELWWKVEKVGEISR